MKTTRMLALVNALGVLAGSAAFAQTTPGDEPASQPAPQESPRINRPDPEARRKALLEKYDANKDGKLDDTELAAIGRDVEQGTLTPRMLGMGPRAGMGLGSRFRGGRGGRGGFGPGPRSGGPGFGPGDQARGPGGPGGPGFGPGPRGPRGGPGFGPRHEELLQKYDQNKDGRLDETEREVIRKDIEDGKLQPPPFGPGMRRLGPPPQPGGAPGVPPPDDRQEEQE